MFGEAVEIAARPEVGEPVVLAAAGNADHGEGRSASAFEPGGEVDFFGESDEQALVALGAEFPSVTNGVLAHEREDGFTFGFQPHHVSLGVEIVVTFK